MPVLMLKGRRRRKAATLLEMVRWRLRMSEPDMRFAAKAGVEAVLLVRNGDPYALVKLPGCTRWRGRDMAPAAAVVEWLRLKEFV